MKPNSIRAALSAATCVLLNNSTSTAVAADEFETDIDSSGLVYSELGRVTVVQGALAAKHEFRDDEFITAKGVIDIMTGASPSGAAKGNPAISITSPSGRSLRLDGDEPKIDFSDRRTAFTLGWIKPFSRTLSMTLEGTQSKEEDYESIGASLTLNKDLFSRMTTLSFGLGGSLDEVEPETGIPEGLTPYTNVDRDEEKSKEMLDGIVGITQILDAKTLIKANYSIGSSSGYLTDPYKFIAFINSTSGEPEIGNGYYFEERPSQRIRQSVLARLLRGSEGLAQDYTYRFFWDDWGVTSHTFDLRYEHPLGSGFDLQWHGRFYWQNKADFYHYHVYDGAASGVDSNDVMSEAQLQALDAISSDYRLGDLNSYTVGAKLAYATKYGEFSGRAEYFFQHDRNERFESLHAIITQLIWRWKFF